MDIKNAFSKKKLIFLAVFIAIALIAQRINFSSVVGVKQQYFTLFQFFGPIAGAFLGSVFGIIAVLSAQLIDFVWTGKEIVWINIFRLTPMLFAAYYFTKKGNKSVSVAIPIICMAAFMIHPVGTHAWFFSLYWTIPVIVKLLPKKYANNLFLRSLGATFTAHAVGSTVFLYSIPMPSEAWIGLIPIVAVERLLFAAGIAGSYVAMNTLLDKLTEKFKWNIPAEVLEVDKQYVLLKKMNS